MSLKIQFCGVTLLFREKLGEVNDEHGEKSHQQILAMERRYQGKWTSSMLADYCWTLKIYVRDVNYRRMS
jgi:hypothetical protein